MSATQPSPERIRRLQMLALIASGVCIPLMGAFLVEGVVAVTHPLTAQTWRNYAAVGAKLASGMLIFAITYRLIRKSTPPGVLTIGLLLALLWAVVLL